MDNNGSKGNNGGAPSQWSTTGHHNSGRTKSPLLPGTTALDHYLRDGQPSERFKIGEPSGRSTGQQMMRSWESTWRDASGGSSSSR